MDDSICRLFGAFRPRMMGLSPRRIVTGALAIGLLLAGSVPSPVAHAGYVLGCAYDRPCFDEVYDTTGDGIYIHWRGQNYYDKYHLRWNREGGPVHTYELTRFSTEGHFLIKPAWKNTRYFFAVQGCHSVLIGHDRCSPFETYTFTTNNI